MRRCWCRWCVFKALSFAQLRHQLEKIIAAKHAVVGQATQTQQAGPQNLDKAAMSNANNNSKQSINDTDASQPEVWNRNAALEALDNDAVVLKSLVEVLAGELRERLAALETALAAGNDEQIRRTAHA